MCYLPDKARLHITRNGVEVDMEVGEQLSVVLLPLSYRFDLSRCGSSLPCRLCRGMCPIPGSDELLLEIVRRVCRSTFKDSSFGCVLMSLTSRCDWCRLLQGSVQCLPLGRRLVLLLRYIGDCTGSFGARVVQVSMRRVGGIRNAHQRLSAGRGRHAAKRIMR